VIGLLDVAHAVSELFGDALVGILEDFGIGIDGIIALREQRPESALAAQLGE
jgi:hypothetical protein